ncbi:MAG: hypothetical protein LC753_04195 [Acidobacteria bacterium]|nr:hypothetical protein [Acidobacteriota bacterium]MCA1649500.1 hypothetical protein [Acidobacteriota bacterium]
MRLLFAGAALLLLSASVAAADALGDARRFYNLGQFDTAERAAMEAARNPALANAAKVVLGRIQLERSRRTPDDGELKRARETLLSADPRSLDARDRLELTVGLAEALYLEDRFGVAAQLFESALARATVLGPVAHDRILDWWATSIDRQAHSRPATERAPLYAQILDRMGKEIAQDPGVSAANYWLAAAARACGDLERAWNAAMAGWVRSSLTHDRGESVRADLDRLVVQGIIPDRAARLPVRDDRQAVAGMIGEWEAFKTGWKR